MKLTIEDNPEAIKRYKDIRPAPHRGAGQCSARCPGTVRTCTLGRSHSGPHVSHGPFRKVLAVWDEAFKARPSDEKVKRVAAVPARGALQDGGFVEGGLMAVWEALRNRVARWGISVEDGVLLILALAMVGVAIDIALRVLGWR